MMNDTSNQLSENLVVITNLLSLAFHRHMAQKERETSNKRLVSISNVSTNTANAHNYGGTNNE